MLMGFGGLNLPYDVPANQYVNFSSGQKQSKSKGTGNWVLDLLDTYDPDLLRFYLTQIMPETSDSEFREEEMVRANNDVLIATWGNLANRVIAMIHRNFEGVVPDAGALSDESKALLADAEQSFVTAAEHYGACQFRNALQDGLRLAQAANRYLDAREPWKAVKADRAHAAETLATALNAVNALKILLHPVIPFSTARLHAGLGQEGDVVAAGWRYQPIPSGTTLPPARALYTKLDTDAVGS
jgi:methionyl-tRNA synthetase